MRGRGTAADACNLNQDPANELSVVADKQLSVLLRVEMVAIACSGEDGLLVASCSTVALLGKVRVTD